MKHEFKWFFYLLLGTDAQSGRSHSNRPKASAADWPKQVTPSRITAKQRVKIIVHLEKGTCRKLYPYHQDPDLFLRNHDAVKNTFIYFKKECFRNIKVHFLFLTILILLFLEILLEIQFSFFYYWEIHSTILVLGRRQQTYCFLRDAFSSCNYKFNILLGICDLVS